VNTRRLASELARLKAHRRSRTTGTESLPTDPIGFVKRALDVEELEPWQERLATSEARRILVAVHRQGGKSSVTSALLLQHALTHPGSLCLVVSVSLRQSLEFFEKFSAGYRRLRGQNLAVPEPQSDRKLGIKLSNGSRVEALPGGTPASIRGFSAPDIVVIDEMAQISEQLLAAILPMLAVSKNGGKLYGLSTPFGRRGAFFRLFEEGGEEWERIRVPVTESRVSEAFVEEMRATLLPHEFASEMMVEFTSAHTSLFDRSALEDALDDSFSPLFDPEDEAV
jgi:hypothetical protein